MPKESRLRSFKFLKPLDAVIEPRAESIGDFAVSDGCRTYLSCYRFDLFDSLDARFNGSLCEPVDFALVVHRAKMRLAAALPDVLLNLRDHVESQRNRAGKERFRANQVVQHVGRKNVTA